MLFFKRQQFLVVLCVFSLTAAEIVNLIVERVIDITTPIVREKIVVVFKNNKANLSSYTFTVSPEAEHYFVEFTNSRREKLYCNQSILKENPSNVFDVHLDEVLEENETYEIIASVSYIGRIKPCHRKRTLKETPVLFYEGNLYFYSPYKTLTLKTNYSCKLDSKCAATQIPQSTTENNLVYSYTNVKPFSFKDVNITFTSDEPLLAAVNLDRTIDVSHWGHIKVKDAVFLKNIGPQLVGPYEPHLLKQRPWLYTHLPSSAETIKYYDEIGNNSKSKLLYQDDHITVKHQMRYPLLHSWKAPYVLQYIVPIYEYLTESENLYILRIRVVDHVVNDGYIENAKVKVFLPEGAILKDVSSPEWFDWSRELHLTDLCIFGRETLVFIGKMLLENHISNVEIVYEFPSVFLLKSPFLIACYLLVSFLFVIIVNRLK